MDMRHLEATDPEIADIIRREELRQFEGIELIASENYVSAAVAETMANMMTNKYAEGLPGKRYYGGCEFVDQAENLAIERAKQLFGAEHANVQPHSGAQANAAVYLALLQPGDTVLGMALDQGGHLTHGAKVNFSGKLYHFVSYGVSRETETIDYDELERLAHEHQPKLIVAGFSAYPRKLDFARFRQIADSVGALLMADIAHVAGLVAVGLYPDPVPYCHVITTTTHKTLRGPRGALILCTADLAAKIDKGVFPGTQGGPLMHTIAAKAVAFKEALTPEFAVYQQRVVDNAQTLATALQEHGFRLVSGGTDNHLMLVDVRPLHVTGRDAEVALEAVHITANKNGIPFDPEPPVRTSGIRLGTPAVTTRGFGEAEMREVAALIHEAITTRDDPASVAATRERAIALATRFPLPGVHLTPHLAEGVVTTG
ncbi:MAG: Serine hydroxymethyltransferase [Ktedonobacterales bacterium]|jgi:glycine hydroxymethyltransferase|nr:MAG: Serine hydroxymethyltransferase [Ktedonobacterales bacterium]